MPRSSYARSMLFLAGASALAMVHAAAEAQDTAPAAAAAPTEVAKGDNSGDGALADIVVTGEKHETTLQTAPLAITAIQGEALKERNINQLNDLNGYVPGLNIAKSEGAERIITIRGIGYETAQNPNSQPGVAFHIDGVYIANVLALNQDLLDVDRVEVLRGPQGTVFGETSTGGAINVITKKPVLGVASGTASVSYGSYNYVKAVGTANIPISDTIAARASVQYFRHDPYGEATAVRGTNGHYGLDDASNVGYRGSILWKPSDTFTALLEGQGFSADHHASLQKDITDPDPRARHVTQDYPGKFQIDTKMIYLTLTQQLGDAAALKSVSAYQYMYKRQTSDNDRLASPFYFDHIIRWRDKSKTFTQEVSLSSVGQQKLEYVIGGFYLRQRALQDIFEVINPFAAAVVLPDGTGVKFQTDSPYQHTSLAGYGNATLHLGDLSLIAGARYNYDKITAQPFQYFNVVPGKKATSSEVTGKIGAEYRFSPQNMIYATGSHGYKPTGLNFNTPGIFTKDAFKKETINAVEVGTKNDFADHRVRLNLAGYYYWYKGLQVNAADPIPFTDGTVNIPRARIYGAEAEFSVLPTDAFRIDGNVSYGHGKLKGDYFAIDNQTAAAIRNQQYAILSNQPGQTCNYFCPFNGQVIGAVLAGAQNTNGNKVPKLPTWQGEISPSYTLDMLGGKLTLRGDVVYRGKFNYRIFAVAALDRVPAYTIYNAFLSYQPDDRPWSVSVSALNLTDKNGVNSKFSDPYGSGTTSLEYIDPREIFGTVSFKF